VAIVAFLMSGAFLLLLVPERSLPQAGTAINDATPPPRSYSETALPAAALETADRAANGGQTHPFHPHAGGRAITRRLPVERDGATHFVAVDDIVAVHANAHYTYVFDGTSKLFCPLAIGDVEARLDQSRFVRVHRSHIVNIDRVVGLKRAGDNGVIELNIDRYTVPVSRGRLGGIRSRLQVRTDAAIG
jgi:DNA-binding LytR/AlgR family response regulator